MAAQPHDRSHVELLQGWVDRLDDPQHRNDAFSELVDLVKRDVEEFMDSVCQATPFVTSARLVASLLALKCPPSRSQAHHTTLVRTLAMMVLGSRALLHANAKVAEAAEAEEAAAVVRASLLSGDLHDGKIILKLFHVLPLSAGDVLETSLEVLQRHGHYHALVSMVYVLGAPTFLRVVATVDLLRTVLLNARGGLVLGLRFVESVAGGVGEDAPEPTTIEQLHRLLVEAYAQAGMLKQAYRHACANNVDHLFPGLALLLAKEVVVGKLKAGHREFATTVAEGNDELTALIAEFDKGLAMNGSEGNEEPGNNDNDDDDDDQAEDEEQDEEGPGLPQIVFEGEVVWVDSCETLERAQQALFQEQPVGDDGAEQVRRAFNVRLVVGVDSEWRPSPVKFRPNPCSVLQVALPRTVFLFDLLRLNGLRPPSTTPPLPAALSPLLLSRSKGSGQPATPPPPVLQAIYARPQGARPQEEQGASEEALCENGRGEVAAGMGELLGRLFRAPDVLKLGFAFGGDLSRLAASFPFLDCFSELRSLLDCGLLVVGPTRSLSALVRQACRLHLDKTQRISNWERRPLTSAQVAYAATDAWCQIQALCALVQGAAAADKGGGAAGESVEGSDVWTNLVRDCTPEVCPEFVLEPSSMVGEPGAAGGEEGSGGRLAGGGAAHRVLGAHDVLEFLEGLPQTVEVGDMQEMQAVVSSALEERAGYLDEAQGGGGDQDGAAGRNEDDDDGEGEGDVPPVYFHVKLNSGFGSGALVAKSLGVEQSQVAKCVVFVWDTAKHPPDNAPPDLALPPLGRIVALVPSEGRACTKRLARATGLRPSWIKMASRDQCPALVGFAHNYVSPFGMPPLPQCVSHLLVDESLAAQERVVVLAGEAGQFVVLTPSVFREVEGCRFQPLCVDKRAEGEERERVLLRALGTVVATAADAEGNNLPVWVRDVRKFIATHGLDDLRVVVDHGLFRVGRWLRCLGVDCEILVNRDPDALVQFAKQARIIVTKDQKFLAEVLEGKHGAGSAFRIVRCSGSNAWFQFREVAGVLQLRVDPGAFLKRCVKCNHPSFRDMTIEEVRASGEVPERVMEFQDEFFQCGGCGKVYWEGPHYTKLGDLFADLMGERGHHSCPHAPARALPLE